MTQHPSDHHRRGFTLVELLIVVGIIAILISLLLPTFVVVRKRAQQSACMNRIHQLVAADLAYALSNDGTLIPGTRDDGVQPAPPAYNTQHCIWISHEAYAAFEQYVASDVVICCPNLEEQLPSDPGVGTLGVVIGYNYLAGHATMLTWCGWQSPRYLRDPGTLPVFCDLNDWAPFDGWTCVAHPKGGHGEAFVYDGGTTATQYPSAGGNVGYLDGSVVWKNLSDMQVHQDCTNGGPYYGMF